MSEKEDHLFQGSNSCWICEKLIDNDEEKVRDRCHVTGKFREFNEFKDTLFNKKVLRHKMRKIKGKKHKIQNQQNIIICFWW